MNVNFLAKFKLFYSLPCTHWLSRGPYVANFLCCQNSSDPTSKKHIRIQKVNHLNPLSLNKNSLAKFKLLYSLPSTHRLSRGPQRQRFGSAFSKSTSGSKGCQMRIQIIGEIGRTFQQSLNYSIFFIVRKEGRMQL